MIKKLSRKNTIYLDSEALKMINYGRTYQYFKISNNIWMDFLSVIYSGGSAGAFINKEIKPFYECVEVS